MWYVKSIDNRGETTLYEHLTQRQASDIHKNEWMDGKSVVSGKMKKSLGEAQ
jgi:hypothetical protein